MSATYTQQQWEEFSQKLIAAYSRTVRALFLSRVYTKKPYIKINHPDLHVFRILTLGVLYKRLKNTDPTTWPLPEPDIHLIIDEAVNEYIETLAS